VSRRWQGEKWTGFVLLLVPTPRLRVDAKQLHEQVRLRLQDSADLADVSTVGVSPPLTYGDRRDAATVVPALLRTATRPGHLVAPRAVFGLVVVDESQAVAQQVANSLANSPRLEELPVYCFGVGASPSPGDSPMPGEPDLVRAVVGRLYEMIEAFERLPSFAIDENAYDDLIHRWRSETREAQWAQSVPARASTAPVPPAPAPRPGDTRRATAKPQRHHTAAPISRPESSVPSPQSAARPDEGRLRFDVAGTFRKVAGRLVPRERTSPELDALDHLARSDSDIELFYMVLLPDAPRGAPGRRREVVLAVDQTLGELRQDTGRPIHTALFVAGRHLNRVGALRPAGQIIKREVPRLPPEHTDLVESIDALLQVLAKETDALARRGVAVSATRVCVISRQAPLADMATLERIELLAREASVSWILLGADPAMTSPAFQDAGVTMMEDHQDVARELVSSLDTPLADPSVEPMPSPIED
jgi:hypothetical protein